MEKSHTKSLLEQCRLEKDQEISIFASPKDERAPVELCGASLDGPKL